MIKWNIELSQFDLNFQPRKSIRGQALADFIAEFTIPEEEIINDRVVKSEDKLKMNPWELYIDGAKNDRRSGAGIVLVTPEGRSLYYALRLEFSATNNDSEYEALIAGLKLAKDLGVKVMVIFCDSKIVVCQVREEFAARGPRLVAYLKKVKELLSSLERYNITHIPREENQKADRLAKLASSDNP